MANRKEVRCIETGVVYPSIAEAAKAVHATISNMSCCLNGVYHSCAGLHWEFTGNEAPQSHVTHRDEEGFTLKQRQYMDLLNENPFVRVTDAAEILGIKRHTIASWFQKDEAFKQAYNDVMDARWKSLQASAQETMSNLVEDGDFQASKYVLDSLGRNAKQQVEVSTPQGFTINIGGNNV